MTATRAEILRALPASAQAVVAALLEVDS